MIPATSKFHIILDKFKRFRVTLNFAEVTNKTYRSNDGIHSTRKLYNMLEHTVTIQ